MTESEQNQQQSNQQQSTSNPFDTYFLSEEAKDKFLDGIARFEQIEAILPQNAKLVATYYHALIKSGIPGEIVFVLVRDYATALTFHGY